MDPELPRAFQQRVRQIWPGHVRII
jgi:hypothetical protein